jgi:hypothetical protein
MKTIKYLREMSDLHLEFGPFHIPEHHTDTETVLLLPGDIHVGIRATKLDWLKNLSQRFAYVLYVLGNHEHYKSSMDLTGQKIKDAIASQGLTNVFVLLDEVFHIPNTNWKVFGGTCWTDFNRANPVTMYNASQVLYDYKKIRFHNYNARLKPEHILGRHMAYKNALLEELAKDDGKNVIVMSHHAPHSLSLSPMYRNSQKEYHTNFAYHSDLSNIILDHPQIKFWFHGHTHNNSRYNIGDDCEVIANPRGYYGHELNDDFDPDLVIPLCPMMN